MFSTRDACYIQTYKYVENKGWRKMYYANSNHESVGVTILISDKIVLKARNITRDKEV